MMTEQIRILRTFFTGNAYSSEKWDMFSKPINAHGEIAAIRTICPKEEDPSRYRIGGTKENNEKGHIYSFLLSTLTLIIGPLVGLKSFMHAQTSLHTCTHTQHLGRGWLQKQIRIKSHSHSFSAGNSAN